MVENFQNTLLEYIGSGKDIRHIANLLNSSRLLLTQEIENLEKLGYLGVATQPNGSIYSCWLTDKGWLHLEKDF
jgi:hypothetical protein